MKGLLRGQAEAAIAVLAMTEDNYKILVDILKSRFGKVDLIVSAHMDALVGLAAASSSHDIRKVRFIYDSVEKNVRQLQNLGISSSTYGTILVPVILKKIPPDTKLIIFRTQKSEEQWDLQKLLDAFKTELEAREKANYLAENNPGQVSGQPKLNRNQPLTASALYTAEKGAPRCAYCKQNHRSNKCLVVTSVAERKAILRKHGKCFACLCPGHLAVHCPSKMKCYHCFRIHYPRICDTLSKNFIEMSGANLNSNTQRGKPAQPQQACLPQATLGMPQNQMTEGPYIPVQREMGGQAQTRTGQVPDPGKVVNCFINAQNAVLLQLARAVIMNPNDSSAGVNIHVVFDNCSQCSYISEHLKNVLNLLTVRTDQLIIKTFGSQSEKLTHCDLVNVCISNIEGGLFTYLNAYTVPFICSPLSNQLITVAQDSYPHLQGLQLADSSHRKLDLEVDCLIGADHYWSFMTNEVKRVEDRRGPVAIGTTLGWVLSGPMDLGSTNDTSSNLSIAHVNFTQTEDPITRASCSIREQLSKFWDIESLGLIGNDSVYDEFKENVVYNGKLYQVSLPFKEGHPLLPDNFLLSKQRLKSLLNRLESKPEILAEYDQILCEQERLGIIETVPEEEVKGKTGEITYIPHKEIVRRDKSTTRLRVVYDASATCDEISLNQCLHAGPSLLPKIINIMLSFRSKQVALVGDLEKAFLMVAVDERHRDFLRFLWISNIHSDTPEIVIKRFCRLVFGLSPSPFLLNATLHHHVKKYKDLDQDFVKEFLNSTYVDDLSSGSSSVEEAFQLFLKSKARMQEAGFRMRKWSSNFPQLMQRIKSHEGTAELSSSSTSSVEEEDQSYTDCTLGGSHVVNEAEEHKVLGSSGTIAQIN